MAYTDIDKPSDYFDTKLYTGTGSTLNITGVDFQPDLVWLKKRNAAGNHYLFDSVRGAQKNIHSHENFAEVTEATTLTSFNSDGFTLSTDGGVNQDTKTFASWNWKAGTSFTNDASSTGIGTIDSTGSVNTDAGFSIITWTVPASGSATVAHGLGKVPKMIISKSRSNATDWEVYHHKTGNDNTNQLNTTAAANDNNAYNDTDPTSSVFSVTASGFGANRTMVSYSFNEVKGFSSIGSYIGTGSDVFIHTGFKVGWLLVKVADGTNGWLVIDTKRSPANPQGKFVYANANSAEGTVTYGEFFSNGFGWKGTNSIAVNQSGKQYIYYAIAENPFVTSTGVPATAR